MDYERWARNLIRSEVDDSDTAAVMDVLLFATDVLIWQLSEGTQQQRSTYDLINDIVPQMIQAGDRVMAFQHTV